MGIAEDLESFHQPQTLTLCAPGPPGGNTKPAPAGVKGAAGLNPGASSRSQNSAFMRSLSPAMVSGARPLCKTFLTLTLILLSQPAMRGGVHGMSWQVSD